MVFAAGPDGENRVKIWGHYYLYFSVAPKDWLSWPVCTQQGRLIGKPSSADGFSYMNRRGGFGGRITCQFIDMPRQPVVLCLSTRNSDIHRLNLCRTLFLPCSRLTIGAKGRIDVQTFYCWLGGFVHSSVVLFILSVQGEHVLWQVRRQ